MSLQWLKKMQISPFPKCSFSLLSSVWVVSGIFKNPLNHSNKFKWKSVLAASTTIYHSFWHKPKVYTSDHVTNAAPGLRSHENDRKELSRKWAPVTSDAKKKTQKKNIWHAPSSFIYIDWLYWTIDRFWCIEWSSGQFY